MTTIEELNEKVDLVTSTMEIMDTKLDEVRAYIASIPIGSPFTQEQADALGVKLDAAGSKAAAVLAEADALDEPGE